MVCSLFTIVPFSVSAYANIDGYPDFDVDVYIAGLMTDSDNPLYRTIENQISLDSPNDVVIKQLKEDTGFQASYAAWQIATFKGGDTVSDPLTEVGYYQSLILNTISEALTSSNVKNAFDNTVIKDAKHLQSTFTNILKLEFVFTDLNDLNVAEMSQDEQIKVMDAFSSSFKKTYPTVSDVGKFVSVFSTIVKEGKALETAINNLVAYTESVGMNDYMKAVVSDLYKNCDSGNVAMKSALFEIDKACQSYELAYSAATFDAVTSSLSVVCEKVVNTMVDGIMAANPAGLSIMIGQAIGKGVANFLFSTDAICEQYHKMCCLYEFEELLGKVTKLEMDSFTKSKTNYNANKIFSAVDFLYKEYDVSCDLAKKYADIIFKECIAGVFFLNGDGYNKYISSVESMRSIAESNYDFLKGDAWMCFLEEDYPDIYNALIKEDEEIENPYIPVTKIAFEKESVEWGTQDTFLNNDKATITPSNASSKGIEYTSSDPSVVSYNKFGAVVHKAGTATVTATSVSSGLTATLNVTVVEGKGADGIALEDPNPGTTANGKCGDNAYWTLYSNGVLNITGTGEIYDYSSSKIPWRYFEHGIKITKVNISSGITRIGQCNFCDCIYLTSINIPDNVLSIGHAAFFGCTSLSDVKLGVNVRKIEGYSFKNCINLKTITISDCIESCGQYSFENCNIEKIIFADGTKTINKNMIVCDTIKSIVVPDSVTDIKGEILDNTDWYKQQKEGLIYAGRILYRYKGEMPDNTSIVLKDGTVKIADSAFSGCDTLQKIFLPNSLKEIGNYAFNRCINLTNITIPSGVNRIGKNAFYQSGLVEIYLPENVKILDDRAFYYCESLASIYVEKGVEFIGEDVFSRTPWFENQKEEFVTINNNLIKYNWPYYDNATHVYMKKIEFPEGIKKICGGSITYPAYVSEVVLPQSLSVIGSSSFSRCWSLTSVKMSNNVEIIENGAFYDCKSLSNINLSDKITHIGNDAFFGCIELNRILIPVNVENIGAYAFGRTWNGNKIDNLVMLGYSGTEAERYAIACNITFVDLDKTKTDSYTNVSVVTELSFDLSVIRLTDIQSITTAKKAIGNKVNLSALYDIVLTKDEAVVQPNGTVAVKIPTGNKNAKVYRIEDDGTKTDMNAIYDNGYMVFTTDHFSIYALVVPNDNVIGDVNGDGVISVADAVALQKYIIKSESLSDEQLSVADTDGNGDVNIKDVTQIQKYLAEYISSLG